MDPLADLPPTMSLETKPGQWVRFTGEGGYDPERRRAGQLLDVGGLYQVEDMSVGNWTSSVQINGEWFNTVLFENHDPTA